MDWTRRIFLGGFAAAAIAGQATRSQAVQTHGTGLDYLEDLGRPGALNPKVAFIPPSRIDPAYSHVIYVNTAVRSDGGQKMWVIERDGAGWRLALWDQDFWDRQGVTGTPPYSWPVSTGRKYPGDARSGPTPLGIFNADDRSTRHRKGWGSPGMYNSIYIDLHYGSGRASGVAMHGTTSSKYRLLGRADSHGCIRMRQANADTVWALFHGQARPGENSPLWSEVPRYFRSAPTRGGGARYGYVRDGSFLQDAASGER
ncbi:MAG: L,D-transpeptidase, partial [Rhodobacter sp.]|nr:L,D-transpeptidase [Rhodobacter sp.]